MAFQYNGSPISIDRPFTAPDGTKFANLRNPAIREAFGVTEVADPPYFDQRFYRGVDNPKLLDDREESDENGDPMWVKVLDNSDPENPVMVDSDERLVTKGLKSQWIAQVKTPLARCWRSLIGWSFARLRGPWMFPAETQAHRAAVVAECDRLEAAIAACADVEALIAVVGSQNWPKT
jgi:hypothetical protein